MFSSDYQSIRELNKWEKKANLEFICEDEIRQRYWYGNSFSEIHWVTLVFLIRVKKFSLTQAFDEMEGLSSDQLHAILDGLERSDVKGLTKYFHLRLLVKYKHKGLTTEELQHSSYQLFNANYFDPIEDLIEYHGLTIHQALDELVGLNLAQLMGIKHHLRREDVISLTKYSEISDLFDYRDGFIKFLKSPCSTDSHLRGLSTPSSSVAWASGTNGTIVFTQDKGKFWKLSQVNGAENLDFRDIKAFNAFTAYVMSVGEGSLSRVYKTENAGQSWALQLIGKEYDFFNCMAFWDNKRGMILSDPNPHTQKFNIYLTENGGLSWSSIPEAAIPPALENEAAFAASGSCMTAYGELDAWFVTGRNNARIYYTRNGGKKWDVALTPIMHDSPTSGIHSVFFQDNGIGVIAGGDYKIPDKGEANLAITKNGGLDWNLIPILPQYYWSSVCLSQDLNYIFVVGPQHAGLIDCESQYVWKKQSKVSLNAVSFWSRTNKALAVGNNGAIVEFVFPQKLKPFK